MDFYYLIIYFIAGIVQNFIFTLHLRYTAKDKIMLSVISSFFGVLLAWLVFYNILTQLDSQKTILAIVIYSAGIASGTYLAMKFRFGFKE